MKGKDFRNNDITDFSFQQFKVKIAETNNDENKNE